MTDLGQKVKIRLIELEMKQVEIAIKCNTTKQNLSGVLKGTSSSLVLEEKLIDWLEKSKKNKGDTIMKFKELEITEEDFKAYLHVQREGTYNMFDPRSRKLTGLTTQKFLGIMTYYQELIVGYNKAYKEIMGGK